ncbi:MAG: lysophospholipase [Flavobacteriales bacterium]|nr:MAG: lysophospholipase [Flavobacteriales bacterium]
MKEYASILSKDGLKIATFSNHFRSEKGVMIITHGMGEHSMRYKEMADFYTNEGYTVISFDIRGHGLSEGKRGHTPGYEFLMDDIERVYAQVRADYPSLPIFLFGHSMGGNLVLNFLLRKPNNIRGAIVTGAYLKLGFEPPKWKIILAKLSSSIWPTLSQPTELELDALSRNKEVIRKYENDELVHDRITSAFFVNVHFAGQYAIDHANEIKSPLLVMHGMEDRLTSPTGSQDFASNSGDNVHLKMWNGLYHELHNEPEKQEIFNYEIEWMNKLLN